MEPYTQIPNLILDEWMKTMSPSAFMVLMVICRKTLGWQKDVDKICFTQIEELTGLSRHTIIRALKELKDKDLIITDLRQGKLGSYELNLTSANLEQVNNETSADLAITSAEIAPELVQKLHIQKKDKETIQNKYYNDEMKEIYSTWDYNTILQKHTEKTLIRNIHKKHYDLIKDHSTEKIKKAILNYAFIIARPNEFWYTAKFTFWRFLEKIDTFLDSADPLNNYKIKNNNKQETQQSKTISAKNINI